MRTGWKIFWISCGILMLVGIACGIAGVALGATTEMINGRFPNGNGFVQFGNESFEPKYGEGEMPQTAEGQEEFSGIRELDIEVAGLAVQVLKADIPSGKARIETEDVDERLNLQYYAENGKLVVKTRKEPLMNGSGYYGTLWLYLPEERFEEAEFHIGAGELYIQDLNAGSASIQVGAGEVIIDKFMADDVSFTCGAGRMEASGEFLENMDIKCGVGEVDLLLYGRDTDYNFDAMSAIGNVRVGQKENGGLGATQSSDKHADKDIHIKCGIGSVEVDFEEQTEIGNSEDQD